MSKSEKKEPIDWTAPESYPVERGSWGGIPLIDDLIGRQWREDLKVPREFAELMRVERLPR